MIQLKTPQEIAKLRQSGRMVAGLLMECQRWIKAGIKTMELDHRAEKYILGYGAIPVFKGYRGYPATLCVSVNDEVVHGIPSERILREGDIVSIDAGLILDGYVGDAAMTFPVGTISANAQKLLRVTEDALRKGIEAVRPDGHIADISRAIQEHVESNGFSAVRDFVGHGVGRQLHEDPQVPNYVVPGHPGPRLKVGMVLALEPMVNEGAWEISVMKDQWTTCTKDGKLSAHFEHMIAVTEHGAEILTIH